MYKSEKNNSKILNNKFPERDYVSKKGSLGEIQLLPVNHLCLHEDYFIFNDLMLPYGRKDIEEKTTFIIGEILNEIIHLLQSEENINKEIIICGEGEAKIMLARKLEDRLKRELKY